VHIIQPEWDVPSHVKAAATCRYGGVSAAGYESLNLATHVGDDPGQVNQNRRRLEAALDLPQAPRWIEQVHSPVVVCAEDIDADGHGDVTVTADGAWTDRPGVVCAVLTADCLPVLLCDAAGTRVAAVHAGWRGLAAGILGNALDVFTGAGIAAGQIRVWFGPAIGRAAYEVDAAVRDAVLELEPACRGSFMASRPGHWHFSLYAAARAILGAQGVTAISGGALCTFSEQRFYSYRRDNVCGRQASLIWIAK
jgi:YfiH family protein